MWFIEREKTGGRFVRRVLDTLSVRPMYIYELRSRVSGAAGYDLRALLARLEAEGKVSHTGNLYQIVKAAQPDAPEPDEREEVPEGSAGWLAGMAEDDARRAQAEAEAEAQPDDELADGCSGDYDYEPDPADQKLPTPTAKDAGRVLDLLKQHAPVPLRMKYIREQLDMGDSDFYRARMLLQGGGEVVQDGESLRLVVAPEGPTPEPEPVVSRPAEPPDAAAQLAQVFVDLRVALERLQAIDAAAIATLSADLRAALHEQQSALLTLFGATLLHLDLGDEGDAAE